ncbi:MAG: ferritin-like domain-containing protein [Rhodoferax sp.]|nr:ferritin-like domain-containing protein [Rhodoferax sp.]
MSIRHQALLLLQIRDPDEKAARTQGRDGMDAASGASEKIEEPGQLPGRPEHPTLVPPSRLVQRAVGTREGRCALLHALAHIEHNAINLALDACWRFEAMPDTYYRDWLSVARDEARHFCLLRDHLATLGCRYGDFPAHDGLWDMVVKTRGDVLARMALVPRTLEARGLDASPAVHKRLVSVGDRAGAAIVDVILQDEIRHVAIGNHWYHYLCALRGLEPLAHYAELSRHYAAPVLYGPFNLPARRAAGFRDDELSYLMQKNPDRTHPSPAATPVHAHHNDTHPRR